MVQRTGRKQCGLVSFSCAIIVCVFEQLPDFSFYLYCVARASSVHAFYSLCAQVWCCAWCVAPCSAPWASRRSTSSSTPPHPKTLVCMFLRPVTCCSEFSFVVLFSRLLCCQCSELRPCCCRQGKRYRVFSGRADESCRPFRRYLSSMYLFSLLCL